MGLSTLLLSTMLHRKRESNGLDGFIRRTVELHELSYAHHVCSLTQSQGVVGHSLWFVSC